jgi:DNA-binding LacI/PurR family transcriptional regulator
MKKSADSPTLTDIAREAGVSVMTVSRALRDAPKVSEKRRKEIKEIAHKLGYRPNPEMSRLMAIMRQTRTKRCSTVMAFVNTFTRHILENNNEHLKTYYEGARERATKLGFVPELFSIGEADISDQRLSRILYSRGIESVVVLPFPYERTTIDLDFKSFYVASIGRSQSEQHFHRACPNQFQATRLGLRECHRLGYKRPGLILRSVMDKRSGYRYSAAYLQHFFEHPERQALPIINLQPYSTTGLKEWLRDNKPDVILGLGPRTLAHIRELGYRVPDDVGFVNLSKLDNEPDISGVDNHYAEVGAAAVDLVVSQMHSFDHGLSEHPKTVLINGTWVDGKTTRPQD